MSVWKRFACRFFAFLLVCMGSLCICSSAYAQHLQLPGNLKTIQAEAFMNDTNIVSAVIPSGAESIGARAFSGCSGMMEITIPDTVTEIGEDAFSGCSNLFIYCSEDSVAAQYAQDHGIDFGEGLNTVIPDGLRYTVYDTYATIDYYHGEAETLVLPDMIADVPVTRIGDSCFEGYTFLKQIKLPRYLTHIGHWAFFECTGLNEISLPDTVVSIGYSAFYNCSSMNGILDLPNQLVSIGENAFSGCRNLTGTLRIPQSVTEIGNGAFSGCEGFKGSLIIPDGITEIADWAFQNCSGMLGRLTLPESLTRIGEGAFSGCQFRRSLHIPDSVTEIGNYAFSETTFDGELHLPDGLTYIGFQAFFGCDRFTGSLLIPDSVTEMGFAAFQGCTGFDGTLKLSENLEVLERGAFFGCSNLKGELILPERLREIQMYAFCECVGLTGDLVISDGIEIIGDSAFIDCSGFDGKLFLGDGLKQIGANAFSGCSNIRGSVDFPSSIEIIGDEAFIYCQNLNGEAILPEGLTELGSDVFFDSGIGSLLQIPSTITTLGSGYEFYRIEILGDVPLSELEGSDMQAHVIAGYVDSTAQMYAESTNTLFEVILTEKDFTYQAVDGGVSITGLKTDVEAYLRVPNTYNGAPVVAIGDGAFANCRLLFGELVIPSTVTSIGESAFENCIGFKGELNLPYGLKTIGKRAFAGTAFAGEVNIPSSVASIGDEAFINCTGLNGSILLHEGLKTIGYSAFSGCTGIDGTVRIPSSVTAIYASAFSGTSLTGVQMYADLSAEMLAAAGFPKTAAFYGFAGSGLEEYLGDSLSFNEIVEDGMYAYSVRNNSAYITSASMSLIGAVVVPDTLGGYPVVEIGEYAFANHASITSVVLPKSVADIGAYAFYGCTSLAKMDIPDYFASIGDYAFASCTALIAFDFPMNCTAFGDYVFKDCVSLKSIRIPDGVEILPENTLYGCNMLDIVYVPESVWSIGSMSFEACGDMTIWCEYNSAAYNYAEANGIGVYYLVLKDAFVPQEVLYQGENNPLFGYVSSSQRIRSVTITLYEADGMTPVHTQTMHPYEKTCSINEKIRGEFKIDSLDTGLYVYEVKASTYVETKTLLRKEFEMKPPRAWLNCNMSGVPSGRIEDVSVSYQPVGRVSSNYPIVYVSAGIYHRDGTPTNYVYEYEYDLSEGHTSINLDELIDSIVFVDFDAGFYSFRVKAKAIIPETNEDYEKEVYRKGLYIGSGILSDAEMLSSVLAYIEDTDNLKVFEKYTLDRQIMEELDALDVMHMMISCGEEIMIDEIKDFFTGNEYSSYYVDLYKKQICEVISNMAGEEDFLSKEAENIFKYALKALKLGDSSLKENITEEVEAIVSPRILESMVELTDIVSGIMFLKDYAAEEVIECIEILMSDYENNLLMLEHVKDVIGLDADPNYVTAYDIVYETYSNKFIDLTNQCLGDLIDKIVEKVSTESIEEMVKTIYGDYSIIKIALKIADEVTGFSNLGEAKAEFMTTRSMFLKARKVYEEYFDTTYNGDHSNEALNQLATSFDYTRECAETMYETIYTFSDGILPDINNQDVLLAYEGYVYYRDVTIPLIVQGLY